MMVRVCGLGEGVRRIMAFAMMCTFSVLGGCYGTGFTRWHAAPPEDATWLGWPVFEAVHADIWLLTDGGESCKTVILRPFAVLMIPVDLAIDLILLPADVIAGVAGCSKNRVPATDFIDPESR